MDTKTNTQDHRIVSNFEDEDFQKFYENGGKEKLSKSLHYHEYTPRTPSRKLKHEVADGWEHIW